MAAYVSIAFNDYLTWGHQKAWHFNIRAHSAVRLARDQSALS